MTEPTTTAIEPTTHTLDVPGAVLTTTSGRNDSSNAPVLLIIGSPMGAAGFVTLAGHFTDRTVVTYDPRGVGAQQAHRRRHRVHARGARRRPAPADRGARTPDRWTSSPAAAAP